LGRETVIRREKDLKWRTLLNLCCQLAACTGDDLQVVALGLGKEGGKLHQGGRKVGGDSDPYGVCLAGQGPAQYPCIEGNEDGGHELSLRKE
jgi:hypothetical protein